MADVFTPEAAVRDYLTFLADPDSLVDATVVAQLEGEVAAAKDPIDRLMAMAKLHKAKATDSDVYEKAFIAQGKVWADAEAIPASAFEQMGVPKETLVKAGIIFVGGRGRRSASRPAPTLSRCPMIKADALEAGILGLDEPFSVKDVSEKVGGSAITVKAAVDRLEAQGKIVGAGERRGKRGRASKTWTVSSST